MNNVNRRRRHNGSKNCKICGKYNNNKNKNNNNKNNNNYSYLSREYLLYKISFKHKNF